MGQVYRAKDTRLKRDVALKILPDAFVGDPDRVARFQREAELLATLNHPNIAAIYGLEHADGLRALVLELVDGPTLADRIAQGPIPIDEALLIARQIADALEAAHEKGVIHRDLKPANIKMTADGQVKVLDFGLAKLLDAAPAAGQPPGYSPGLTNSPTVTTPAMTMAGVILGTAAYMSPEQAKGRPADKRSDIWAFGCVLYQMLTGRRAFDGDDVSDTLAAVLRGDPNWAALPADVPVPIRTLAEACLRKDARQRISDVSAILFVLDNQSRLTAPAISEAPPPRKRPGVVVLSAAVLVSAIVGILASRLNRPPEITRPVVTRFAITLPPDQQFTHNGNRIIDISPDGTNLVYVANKRLYLRSIAEFDARPIAGTEISEGLISGPMFSPDGQSVAYWVGDSANAGGALKRISLAGGTPSTLSRLAFPAGLNWGPDGIVAGSRNNTIVRIPSSGGAPELLATAKEGTLCCPQLLPGGDAVLFTATKLNADLNAADEDTRRLVVQSLKSGESKTILVGGTDGRYIPTGHIVYIAGTTLFAVPFDLGRREAMGRGVPLVENVSRRLFGELGRPVYATVSATGTLAYVSGAISRDLAIELIDRAGHITALNDPRAAYAFPRISRDGKQLAVELDDDNGSNIWVRDMSDEGPFRQLTLAGNRNRFPVWSPDGQSIAFQSDRNGDAGLFEQRADGTGTVERLTRADRGTTHVPDSWSSNGQTLLFTVTQSDGTFTLSALSQADRKVVTLSDVRSTRYTPAATFSPDGRWFAYTASEGDANPTSGAQIVVQPFPPTGARYPVARGLHPLWSPDGKELFYHRLPDTPDHMAVVRVTTQAGQPGFAFTTPASLTLRDMQYSQPGVPRNWDIMPDGYRFLGLSPRDAARGQIDVVMNWTEELKQRVPTR
jgi:serine/threonine-protein kinase